MIVRMTLAQAWLARSLLHNLRMVTCVSFGILAFHSSVLVQDAGGVSGEVSGEVTGADLAAIIEVPERLERDATAGALAVLTRHCARCHQSGRLERSAPAAGFDGILDLPELLRRPDLVVPGRPDASRLYQAMLTRHMPYDIFQDGEPGEAPSAGEIRQVRDWISAAVVPGTCAKEPASRTPAVERIMGWISKRPAGEAERTRFVTLSHLARGCGEDGLADRHRAGMLEAIYAASWSQNPERAVRPIDAAGDIYAIDLPGLGWSSEAWDMIARAGREVGSDDQRTFPLILLESTQTPSPMLTGDFLAASLLDPHVYSQVMQFPLTRRVFEAVIGLRLGAPGTPVFASIDKSAQTGGARLAMRRGHGHDAFAWWSFDAKQPGTAVVLQMLSAYLAGEAVGAAGYQVLFRLPGGFLASASFNSDGVLIGAQPQLRAETAREGSYGGTAVASGGCHSCHSTGLVTGLEAIDDRARRIANADKDGALLLFSQSTLDARLASDRFSLVAARRRAGLPEGYLESGAVGGLAREHRVPLDMVRAASELGMPVNQLKALLANLSGPLMPAARRLDQGLVTRVEFAALARALAQPDPNDKAARADAGQAESADDRVSETGPPVGLSIWADQSVYKVGEAARFFASSDRDCNLTLINVDQAGQATVLYPSEFHPENAIKAGEVIQVPGSDAGYLLAFAEPGNEKLVGICMEGERRFPPGIRINYERQRFTLLGEWRSHLDTYLAADAKERANVGKKKRRRRARWRQRGYQPPARKTRLPLPQLRSAITIEIGK